MKTSINPFSKYHSYKKYITKRTNMKRSSHKYSSIQSEMHFLQNKWMSLSTGQTGRKKNKELFLDVTNLSFFTPFIFIY